jgi:cystathionine beta-lyase/cystathionine gamma-synthase
LSNSTYLNGHADCICGAVKQSEPARPRFATAWMHGDVDTFAFTGDAFMTLAHAEEFARMTLENDGSEGQIAVFEIRSVHLARLDITSEVA